MFSRYNAVNGLAQPQDDWRSQIPEYLSQQYQPGTGLEWTQDTVEQYNDRVRNHKPIQRTAPQPQRNSLRNMGGKRNPDDWVTGWNRDGKRYSVRKGSGHEGSVLMERPQGLGRNKQRNRGGNSLMGLGGKGQRSNPYNFQNNQYSPQITQQSNGMAQYSQPQPQQSPYSLPPQVPYTPQGIQGFTPQYTPPAMQPQPQAPVQQSQPVQQVQNQPYQSPFTRFAIANRNRIGFR
jgi:hypothetical protein